MSRPPINYNINREAMEILRIASQIQERSVYDQYVHEHALYEVELHHFYDFFIIELYSYDELLSGFYDFLMFNDIHVVKCSIERVSSIIKNEYKRQLQDS